MLQNILQYRFDQIFDAGNCTADLMKQDMSKKNVPLEMLLKGPDEDQKISKEEENTFILQVIVSSVHKQ